MNDDLSGLDLVELLARLEPVAEPAPVSLLPQTAGWACAGAALLFVLIRYGYRLVTRYRENAYRRAALRALTDAGDDPAAIAAILRRTALVAYPRAEVAGLFGDDWLRFLDARYHGAEFLTGTGRVLASAPYQSGEIPAVGLGQLAATWVRGHVTGKHPTDD